FDVQPVVDEGFAGRGLRLGDLVLVVGEDEVFATGMDIEGRTELGHAHGGAFDMPPRPSFTPGGGPDGADFVIYLLGGFPEGEVSDVALFVFVGRDAFSLPHLGGVDA